jgi:hypothetical protein
LNEPPLYRVMERVVALRIAVAHSRSVEDNVEVGCDRSMLRAKILQAALPFNSDKDTVTKSYSNSSTINIDSQLSPEQIQRRFILLHSFFCSTYYHSNYIAYGVPSESYI